MGEEPRDKWSIIEILVKALAGVLIPLMIFIAGHMITTQQQKIETAQRNADRIALFLTHMASDNPRERLLTIKVMEYFAHNEQYPADLIHALVSTVERDDSSEVVLAASNVLAKATRDKPELSRTIRLNLAELPPRVYIHIRREEQRPRAREIGGKLESSGFVIPGIERLVEVGPSTNQLRYFRKEDGDEARRILELMASMGVSAELMDLSARYGESDLTRHYEVWFGPDFQ